MCEIYAYSGEVNKTFNDELREFSGVGEPLPA